VKETVEHNNRFYKQPNGEILTESEQLKEWLILANKEIERLNNIINELEKTILEWHEYWEDDDSYSWQYKNAYDYLQELKGSDKE